MNYIFNIVLYMVIIGWSMFLLILLIGLHLDGIALGLLSGLGLGLLTFFGCLQPVLPPYDLVILQAAWLILTSILEMVGFFYMLETQCRRLVENDSVCHTVFVTFFCYCIVFLTGDRQLFNSIAFRKGAIASCKPPIQLLLPVGVAIHMALLISPLSISGILLFVVFGNSLCSFLDLIVVIGSMTVGLTVASSLVCYLIPSKSLVKLEKWLYRFYVDDISAVVASKGQKKFSHIFLLLLLLLAELVFFLLKPQNNSLTRLSYFEKVFPVRFPMFFVLIMLSLAAMVLLFFNIRPVKVLQTSRFKLGIEQFFIFFGLAWLIETLINHDKVFLIKIFTAVVPCNFYIFYPFLFFYLSLIGIPMVIWFFVPLLMEGNFSISVFALLLVVVHILPVLKCWGRVMVRAALKGSILKYVSRSSIYK